MAGGTHHAHRDYGSDIVFNDLAISALYAIKNLGVKRVAILDWMFIKEMEQQLYSLMKIEQEQSQCTVQQISHLENR